MRHSGATATRWWDEWGLRVLVLASLGVQYAMLLIAGKRKFCTPGWFRIIVRILFIGCDVVALAALATLFNRQKSSSPAHIISSSNLEVLWAPILLMHIGGQAVATVSSIEKHDQLLRFIQTALTKGAVAAYLFYKSWSSTDMRLLTAAILLFIALIPRGIIKSLSLKQTGFNYMQDKSNSVSHRMDQKQLQETLKEMRFLISIMPETSNHYEIPAYERLYILRYMPSQLCLDYVRSYKSRRQTLESFWRLDDSQLYRVIEDGLSLIFSRLYTEDSRVDYIYSWWPDIAGMNLFVFLCLFKAIGNTPLIIAIALFHTSHKEAYSGGDITVTFVLLYGTLFLEFSFLFKLLTFRWKWQWRSTVPQLSILRFFTHHKRHSKLMGIARWFRFSSLLYSRWGKEAACDSSLKITTLVRQHIKLGWNNTINDAETYKMFNDTTGEWTFNLHNCNQFLELMSPYPLDESVIIWHLATDLCFYIGGAPNHDNAKRSREISNYMVYLLFTNPDMLTVSSRKSLFKTGCRELEYLLSDDYHEVHSDDPQEKHSDDMECLAKQINDRLTSQSEDPIRLNYISTAWNLSKNLRELNEEKMWKVIQGVWVEILCFSAGRCQGVLHAKSLGSGGEYLSYVWFLQAYAGLETFPDKLQKTHLMSTFQSPQREFTQNTSRSDLT